MDVSQIGTAFAVADPTAAGRWVEEHLGLRVLVDLGWYVATAHPALPGQSIDFVSADHDTWPEPVDGVRGVVLALVVGDVDAEHERLVAAGVRQLKPLVTEPWGQRRCQVAGPDGLVVELVQPVDPDPAWLAQQGLAQ